MCEKYSDIVVTGISGRFPKSRNLKEFKENLFNKVDMIDDSDERFQHYLIENLPPRSGKIPDLDRFDAAFFSMMNVQARFTDPQMRILLEHAYEAILDAGISPQSLIGSNTGVIIGCSVSESMNSYVKQSTLAFEGVASSNNAMLFLANRISYTLGLRGPSFVVDTACSSAAYAMDCAYNYLRHNLCDAVIVAGTQLILSPYMFLEFNAMGILSPDGISKIFDEDSKGFVRSDTIAAVFLQKRENAKRIYAQIVHSLSNNDGFKNEGIVLPSKEVQQLLMEKLYNEVKVDLNEINYFEAHATGTKLGDYQEIIAVDKVYCKDRKNKLQIGSVKSNMGHSEAASAMASLSKILIAFESGKIPPNINLNKLRDDISAFAENRIEVLTETADLKSPYIAMNSFGLGGSNVHILLKQNSKEKIIQNSDEFERMLLWSGRTENAVHTIFDDITSRPLDIEHIALLQNTQIITPNLNCFRGFGIFKNSQENAICIERNVQKFDGTRRSIVWAYAGMGSQWYKMGQDLMKIPLFADSIEKCHEILLENEIDLKLILNSNDEKIYDNILNVYVALISIEIALTDILHLLNIKPDFIVGHSLGEIACAYADGCLTMKEALMVACIRAKITLDLNVIDGAMAVVGMNSEDLKEILPKNIDIACYNAENLITITGAENDIFDFIEELKSKNIFVKHFETAKIPFHSRYLKPVAEKLYKILPHVLKNPKIRSSKWITTTYEEENENNKICDAKYQIDNVINPVYFEKALKNIPKNSIIIEISPHGLLRSLFKRILNENIYESLINKTSENHEKFFIQTIGRIFQHGVDLDISKFYPTVEFPVSRGTPMISPIIKWNHEDCHFVPKFKISTEMCRISKVQNFMSSKLSYIHDHILDGKAIVPASYWFLEIWKHFSAFRGRKWNETKITLTEVECVQIIYPDNEANFTSFVNPANGKIEIFSGENLILKGIAKCDDDLVIKEIKDFKYDENEIVMTKEDFYKFARINGYHYKDNFMQMNEITTNGMKGKIKWNGNWTCFVDSILQVMLIDKRSNLLELPHKLDRISIDPFLHFKIIEEAKNSNNSEILIPFQCNLDLSSIICGGIELSGPSFVTVNRKEQKNVCTEFLKFVPFVNDQEKFELATALKIQTTIFVDRIQKITIDVIEISEDFPDIWTPMIEIASRALQGLINFKILSNENREIESFKVIANEDISMFKNIHCIYARYKLNDSQFLDKIENVLDNDGMLITLEKSNFENFNEKIEILSKLKLENDENLLLTRFKKETTKFNPMILKISPNVSEWIEILQKALLNYSKETHESILIYSKEVNENLVGLFGFYNCLRQELPEIKIKCVIIYDENAPEFDITNSFYKLQLQKDLKVNILKNYQWGSFFHLNMKFDIEPKPYKEQCFANYTRRGNLSSIKWHQGPLSIINPQNNPNGTDLIKIQYAALNFKDIVHAFGYIPDGTNFMKECSLGMELCGIRVSTGERVAIMARNTAGITSYYDASDKKNSIVLNIPDDIENIDFVSSLLTYFTVYYSFFNATKIRKGKSILIHSGSGGVGQAALNVAFANGLEVFTTVGNEEKKTFLLKTFPQLKPEHIGNSRDTSFYEMVMKYTHGRGVDYVLNSLSGDKMIASLNCTAENGYFLEIGHAYRVTETKVDLKYLEKKITIKSIRLDLFDDLGETETKEILKMFMDDLKNDKIKAMSRTIFDANDVSKAFQHMSTGNHIGKVVIKIRENLNDEETLPISITPRFYCNSKCSYILVGGLGGLGLEFAEWLVGRKCRKIVFNSRNGISNQYQVFKINYLKSLGAKIIINTSDASTLTGCEELIQSAINLGHVDGIFNFATVIHDGMFLNRTVENFNITLKPKFEITKYLDELSVKLCPKLRHFIVYSSMSCGRGTPGQTAYGLANSRMENIILKRFEKGLPGKALQWGPIADAGLLGKMGDSEGKFNMKISLQSLSSFLEYHDILLTHPEPIVACTIFQSKKNFSDNKPGFIDMMMHLFNVEDRNSLSKNSTFSQLGVDSLAGIEVQVRIEREFGINFTTQELRTLTLGQIEEKIEKERKDK